MPRSTSGYAAVRPPPQKRQAVSSASVALTDEERQRRLQQMQQNAQLHEEKTARRLDAAAEEERREKEDEAKRMDQKDVELRPDFLERVNKKVYAGSTSMEERLTRGAHYRQRPIDLESKGVAHM